MPRLPRVVLPDIPHHVLQRGTRKQQTFFRASDYQAYLRLLRENCTFNDIEIWAYCLMPNHVHLILSPSRREGLSRAVGDTQCAYARTVNRREGWTGNLWQGRFTSFPMDEAHLLMAARYVELNPVRAGMVKDPATYLWSSARERLSGGTNELITKYPLNELVPDWAEFLRRPLDSEQLQTLRQFSGTGRPAGNDRFIDEAERQTGWHLRPLPRGRRPVNNN